jgi:glycosyltransferase involved in cell wall biosynthesis
MLHPPSRELPPSQGKVDWPWTPNPIWKPDFPLDGTIWPRVTIVTPSYNQGIYLEETIRSVLLQGYPNLEYFIMDGGSTDNTLEIIKKYEPWITDWVSEKDHGQSHAINKGFERATGEWLGWLNSDDCYAPYGLFRLVNAAQKANANFVFSSSIHFDIRGRSSRVPLRKSLTLHAYSPRYIRLIDLIDQPATLWTRELFEQNGPLQEDMHYAFDWDFFIRASSSARPALCDEVTAVYRFHDAHKTGSGATVRMHEIMNVFRDYLPSQYRTRFLRVLPVISLLVQFSLANQRKRRFARFLSRVVLLLISKSGLLSLSGLPNEIWEMLTIFQGFGRFRGSENCLAKFEYANVPASTVAEALAQFPPVEDSAQ